MFVFICLFLAFIALLLLAFELLMLGICLFLLGVALTFIFFWFKFLLWFTWPYGFIILIGIGLLIWIIGKIRNL
jgi:hypothetical protein